MTMLPSPTRPSTPDETALRARFDGLAPFTVGVEEEVLLLDPVTLQPVPEADVIVSAAQDPRIKRELPACQAELLTAPHTDPLAAVAELASARARLLELCGDGVRPVAAAVHPTATEPPELARTTRHRELSQEYREVARRQVVGALQVHVAVGSADATLPVYNALRGYLPELAALAASAPFHEGRDTGLASVRPLIAGQLPRQGVPPAFASWAELAEELRWGAASGTVSEPRRWWWELRPHVLHGTLEVRVPDAQASTAAASGLVTLIHALVVHLAERHRDGEPLPVPATWRIAENRWSALRDGVHGTLYDLETGEARPTARHLHELIDAVEPWSIDGLDAARGLVDVNGADQIRAAGIAGAARWLAEAFSA